MMTQLEQFEYALKIYKGEIPESPHDMQGHLHTLAGFAKEHEMAIRISIKMMYGDGNLE